MYVSVSTLLHAHNEILDDNFIVVITVSEAAADRVEQYREEQHERDYGERVIEEHVQRVVWLAERDEQDKGDQKCDETSDTCDDLVARVALVTLQQQLTDCRDQYQHEQRGDQRNAYDLHVVD